MNSWLEMDKLQCLTNLDFCSSNTTRGLLSSWIHALEIHLWHHSKGRTQDFKEGGSNTATRAKRARKISSYAHFPETTPICVRLHGLFQLQISRSRPIDTKVRESMSLLVSILVSEGFLLVYFQCWSKPEMNYKLGACRIKFNHLGCDVGGVLTNDRRV